MSDRDRGARGSAAPGAAPAPEVWSLHHLDWFEALSDPERDRLRAAATIREFAPGETIFAPSPTPQHVYLLERGRVRIYRLSENGSETTFGYVTPGEVFGELTALGDYARESFAQAAEPVRAWKVPRKAFQEVMASHPSLVLGVTRQIGDRLKRIESRVENLVFRDVHTRIMLTLCELAETFGREGPDGEVEISVPITQSELATLVGSTRQSVNVSLGELTDRGLLRKKGRHLVVNKVEELRRAALPTS